MSEFLPAGIERFVRTAGPEPDETLREMDEYAREHGFPHVGTEVGGLLRLFARTVGAGSIFEFGSGYGYSAYWFAGALPEDGRIVLTEVDEDELDMAEEYMARGGFDHLAEYEHGDALDAIERYDGPFDVVLIDHQKHRYTEAFEAVRGRVASGGIVVADNVMAANTVYFDGVRAALDGERDPDDLDEFPRGIADYLGTVRTDPDFETAVIPLGEGIAVSHRRG